MPTMNGKAMVTPIAGTDLSGANGLETSHGGRVLYVNAWGAHQIVRFDRRGATLKKDVVSVDFAPDNLRWNADGTQLIVAGQKFRTGGKLNADRTIVYSPSYFPEPGLAMYTNLTVNWTWKAAPVTPVQFYVSVQNLFNRSPSTIGGGGTVPGLFPGTFAGDDLIGRYYTTGMRLRF